MVGWAAGQTDRGRRRGGGPKAARAPRGWMNGRSSRSSSSGPQDRQEATLGWWSGRRIRLLRRGSSGRANGSRRRSTRPTERWWAGGEASSKAAGLFHGDFLPYRRQRLVTERRRREKPRERRTEGRRQLLGWPARGIARAPLQARSEAGRSGCWSGKKWGFAKGGRIETTAVPPRSFVINQINSYTPAA